MKKVAILIAVDSFADPTLPAVPFAEADASALASALEAVGFAGDNRTLLLGSAATKTTIESRLRKLARQLEQGDEVLFFYAGLGFTTGGRGFLACRDTDHQDLAQTSLAVWDLANLVRAAGCRAALFFDAGAAPMDESPPEGIEAGLADGELRGLFGHSSGLRCFLASWPGEASHPAAALKHRAWGWHLIQAFAGSAVDALRDGRLTDDSLQSYVERELPRTLRKVLSVPASQTPALFGGDGKGVLADLRPVLALKKSRDGVDLQQLRRVVFRTETRGKVKDLAGYQKGHRIPDQATPSAEKFVARIAAQDVRGDVEETFNTLREQMGFKRKDLEAAAERDGQGFVRTPVFDYTVGVSLDPADPTEVVWRREVSHIQDPAMIRGPGFQAVFGTTFDTLVFEFTAPLDIAELVDRLEEEPIAGVHVRSSIDASACEITLDGFAGAIQVQADRLTITGRSATAAALVDQFFEFQRRFSRAMDLPALKG
jgi:Caspase domain